MQQQPSVDIEPEIAKIEVNINKELEAISKVVRYVDNRLKMKSDMSDLLKLEELVVGMI